MIPRTLKQKVLERLDKGKIILLMGARQVGKTTLLEELFGKAEQSEHVLWLSGDDPDVAALLEQANSTRLGLILGSASMVIIDEAQRIRDIGLKLKLMADRFPHIQVVATGSSSLALANKVNEPLTGRKEEYTMFPLSFEEMAARNGLLDEKRLLPSRLVYGYYPEVVNNPGREKKILKELSNSYLYKDILMWEQIKKPEKLIKLLQALAFQTGSQVSYNELSQLCGMDAKTVERYIVLLEQCFVIFRLGSFSRNLRNELKFSRKVYFYDNGIRNAVLADFSLSELRQDMGKLWENFLVSERKKFLEYHDLWKNCYFWRTTEQQEIDYLEEGDGILHAFEFKWGGPGPGKSFKYRKPKSFVETYKPETFTIVSPENAEEFLLGTVNS
jgi:predicted AAA+ superfamily ATPase